MPESGLRGGGGSLFLSLYATTTVIELVTAPNLLVTWLAGDCRVDWLAGLVGGLVVGWLAGWLVGRACWAMVARVFSLVAGKRENTPGNEERRTSGNKATVCFDFVKFRLCQKLKRTFIFIFTFARETTSLHRQCVMFLSRVVGCRYQSAHHADRRTRTRGSLG
jgi:hypothetical protein